MGRCQTNPLLSGQAARNSRIQMPVESRDQNSTQDGDRQQLRNP